MLGALAHRRVRVGTSWLGHCGSPGGDAAMTQPAKGQEPSMEEILASIRRIISDDDTMKPQPTEGVIPGSSQRPLEPVPSRPEAGAVVTPFPAPDSSLDDEDLDFMLAQLQVTRPPAPAAGAAAAEPAPGILDLTEEMAARDPERERSGGAKHERDVVLDERSPAASAAAPPPNPEPPRAAAPDISSLLSAATSAAVDSAFNNLAHTVLAQNARTLEDLVREMLRPMLKTWLDDNLPSLVERLVRAEIERVSRGKP
ncbi:MAG: PopZ family protein [Xanthobacteraceae bacterium]